MKRVMIRACSYLKAGAGAFIVGLALLAAAATPPARGQSAVWLPQGATSGNIYYNGGNVGIVTLSSTSRVPHILNGALR
jgi:hypothetical protein